MPKGTASLAALNAAISLDLSGNRDVLLTVPAGLVGTIVLEATRDQGATYETLPIFKSDGTIAQSVANPSGLYRSTVLAAQGLMQVRARVSAYTSGSAAQATLEVLPV